MALPEAAYPGLLLAPASKYVAGPGTYTKETEIYASLAGPVKTTSSSESNPKTLPVISVQRPTCSTIPSRFVSATNVLPAVNDIVLARVMRLQARQVTMNILVVGEHVCADHFSGAVRKEDVRGWEVDKVVIAEGFAVGDIVRAVVISLGDHAHYYLSTARNELGVLMAASMDGNAMFPISWKEFRDPMTGKNESRKVAKPF